MVPNVIWEKYENPYLAEIDGMIEQQNSMADSKEYYDDDEEGHQSAQPIEDLNSYVHTPFGAVPVPNVHLDDNWNMWTGHTNTKITVEIANKIEDTAGVEILQVFSPYRFIISIAQHPDFSPGMVMAEVAQNAFGVEVPIEVNFQHKLEINVSKHKDKIIKTGNPYWFIFSFPNGKVISRNSAEESEKYLKALSIVNDLKDKVNGMLITNQD
jgi:hypothetical protein